MEEGKVIFEKKYPKLDWAELEAEMEKERKFCSGDQNLTADEIVDRMSKDIKTVEMPERRKTVIAFIQNVTQIAETYEVDVRITQYETHVTADFFFDGGGRMGFLKEAIAYADDISIFQDKDGADFKLSIDHYTHAVYRKGRKVLPLDWTLNTDRMLNIPYRQ